MKTKEEVLEHNGFDIDEFKFENEHSAKNLLSSMQDYADQEVKRAVILFANWLSKEIKTDRLMQQFDNYKNQVNE